MEYFMENFFPAIMLFLSQTILCLWCRNKYIRLIPTVIALGITLYHLEIVIRQLQIPSVWNVMVFGYLAMTVLPSLAAVGFGWIVYVVKLMIRESKELRK